MRTRILLLLCAAGLVAGGAAPGRAAESDNVLADELDREGGRPAGGRGRVAGVLRALRTRGDVAPDRLAALVEQLGSKNGADREKAAAELTAIGPPAVPALRAAAKDPDAADAAGLARRCLTALEADSATVSAAAVRLIAQRRPDGAAAALLAYLPYAEDDIRSGRDPGRPDGHGLPRRQGRPRPAQGPRRRVAAAPGHGRGCALPERPRRAARRPPQAAGRPQADGSAARRPGPGPGPRRQRRHDPDRPARRAAGRPRAATPRSTCPTSPAIRRAKDGPDRRRLAGQGPRRLGRPGGSPPRARPA